MSMIFEKTRALGAPTGPQIAALPAAGHGVPAIWMEDFRP